MRPAYFALSASVALIASVALAPGCSPRRNTPREASRGAVSDVGAGSDAGVDTGRVGRTFVVTYDSGPIDRLRIVRDTAGRIVVEGASGFPDGTVITVALLRPLAEGKSEPAAITRARVELGRFQSSPLQDASSAGATAKAPTAAPGMTRLLLTASFAPGAQTDAVMHASASGRRFRGHGMREAKDGFAVYEQTIEAPL